MSPICPKCQARQLEPDENGIYWCDDCEFAWFEWTRAQEAARLA